ncbi:hypothetical protein ACFSRY_18430 [Pontibacter locisalis]|uniref:Lipocalin-like domain-containing protein n=1 Tax=Pontibacter locisalis TaxID=1719035 RepID=A0ABW5IUW2_9BACT
MNKIRILSFLFAALFLSTLTSCDKDDEDQEPSKRDLLTAGTWTGTAIYANGQDFTQVFIDELGYDIKKNTVKFDKAGTYVDTYERVSINGTWEFTNNEQAILFDKGDPDNEYIGEISKLDSDELFIQQDLEIEDDEGNVSTIDLEVRYKRQ